MQHILLLVGTMVGAGFASGKEIATIFLSSHSYAILGLLLSNILTGIIIYKVIQLVQENHIQNYQQLLLSITPQKYTFLGMIFNSIINLFLLASFYIMIAGFATYIAQKAALPLFIGIAMALIITYLACRGNIQSLTNMNKLLMPLLILVVIHIWLQSVDNSIVENLFLQLSEGNVIDSCVKAVLYSSYNSIVLIPIIIEIAKHAKQKGKTIAIGTSAILFVLSYCITTLLYQPATPSLLAKDLLLLEVVQIVQPNCTTIYGIMIAIAMITSAIAAIYGYLQNITKTQTQYNRWLGILCITAIPIAYIGFSNLINTLYPVFGIIGCVQIVLLFRKK